MKPNAANAARGAEEIGINSRKRATQQKVIGVMSQVLYGLRARKDISNKFQEITVDFALTSEDLAPAA